VKTGVCVRTRYVLRIQKRRRQLILSLFPSLPDSSSHEHIAVYQMCYRWRWGCREDLHANILYQQHVSHASGLGSICFPGWGLERTLVLTKLFWSQHEALSSFISHRGPAVLRVKKYRVTTLPGIASLFLFFR
jgi:hypothetical protein